MRLLAVIPARLGSSRLPHKPLCPLDGEPLVRVVARQAVRLLRGAAAIVVASDDERVLQAVEGLEVGRMLTRTDHESGTARVAEVASHAAYRDCEWILNLQGDEPFLTRRIVRGALSCLKRGFGIGTAAARLDEEAARDPNRVKVVVGQQGRALDFTRRPPSEVARPVATRMLQHIGIYAYTRQCLRRWVALPATGRERRERLEQLRPMDHGIPIGVAASSALAPLGIDTQVDLSRAEAQLAAPRVGVMR